MNSPLTSASSQPISVSMPSEVPPKKRNMTDVLRPVAPHERIHGLDLLRGWAMFGVLWSNIYGYATYQPESALDRALRWTHHWLVQDRFYTLLILLFGVGFGIQLTRANSLGTDLRNTYYRRSAALLTIGIVHGTLIWDGDVLTTYALAAFALVMFRTTSTRKVIVDGALLWIAGPIIVRELMFLSGLRFMAPWLGDFTAIMPMARGSKSSAFASLSTWIGSAALGSFHMRATSWRS